MRSLFLKIFLSFWLAQALFVILAIFVVLIFRPQRDAAWESLQAKVLSESVQAYQSDGEAGARRYLSDLQESQHVRAFLFDEEAREISGARPPEWVEHFERGQSNPQGFLRRLGPDRFLRQSTIDSEGHHYTLVMELPPGPRMLLGPRGVPGLWILIAVITSGVTCYILAKYLTKPVVRLRAATQKLAAGDLSARAGEAGKGRDEIAQLVRDFDSMASRLEAMVKAQSRLWSDISHELRSPLARLNVALELARQRSGADAQSALERIGLEANRLNELIGRLLTIARLESGEEHIERSSVHLEELISEVARDAEFEIQSRNASVEVSIAEDLVVLGSGSLLRSAIENVVRNAIRYTREGTSIEIRLEKNPDTPAAILTVTDCGPGVPADSLDKLFRPFYRIDDARGRQTGGVGLGLAITERAVRLHGGSVRAENRPTGGLLVEISLPLTGDVPQPTPELAGQIS
jgi:two-component system, OmpR family, sensor histidine kinase CpxA